MGDRLYRHNVVRINYTSYDVRRCQDSLNAHSHADFMVKSHEETERNSHPYWYGRIITAFHAEVCHTGPDSVSHQPQHMEFLWVRWYGRDMESRAGWKAKRLHRVGFVPSDEPYAFGFLNPKEVIRGVHLIPAFEHGQTSELLPPSVGRPQPFVRRSQAERKAQKYARPAPSLPRQRIRGRDVLPLLRAHRENLNLDYVFYYLNM